MDSGLTQQANENILIVKGRFKSTSMNLYGLFLLIFNTLKKLDISHVIVSSYSDMYDFEPHTSWEKYEEIIVDRKWKGNFNNSMTASIMDTFNKLSEDARSVKILYDHVYNYDYDQMDLIIYDNINRIIHDKNLTMETIIQEVSAQEFRKIKEDRSKPAEAEKDKEQQDTKKQSTILQVKPIVAPINGKPIYSMRIGDRILVKIIPASSRENYYIDLYNLKDDRTVRAIPATVVDIKAGLGKNNPVEILTEIAPGVYGQFTEEEKQVKLKLYDPLTDDTLDGKKAGGSSTHAADDDEAGSSMKSIIIMAVLFVVILTLFIMLILISW